MIEKASLLFGRWPGPAYWFSGQRPKTNGQRLTGLNVITTTEKNTSWLQAFEEFNSRRLGPAWLEELRRDAFACFWELGFPTVHDEDWRFTSVAPIANRGFRLAQETLSLSAADVRPYRLEGSACQLVFVNGHFAPALSNLDSLPPNVTVCGLAEMLAKGGAEIRPYLGHYESFQADAFTALNTAFCRDGAFVHVPRGTLLQRPICLLYISTGDAEPQMVHPRNLIVLGPESQAAVLEDYVSLRTGLFLSNVVTELVVGENSIADHFLVEREDRQAYNISTLRIQQDRNANVASHSVLVGGALVRNNVHPVLAGEGGECSSTACSSAPASSTWTTT